MKLLLLLLASLQWGKLATTGGTMLLSLAVYATIWGCPCAAGFIVLIFAHEMGHYVAARQGGLNVGALTFIPFLGAWIALKGLEYGGLYLALTSYLAIMTFEVHEMLGGLRRPT